MAVLIFSDAGRRSRIVAQTGAGIGNVRSGAVVVRYVAHTTGQQPSGGKNGGY